MHLVAALGSLVGCGEVPLVPDAAIDAEGVIDTPPPPAHSHFVIDRFTLPTTNAQARDLGFDLDGDLSTDNQLGMVLSALSQQGFDNQLGMDQAIDRGTAIMLGDLAVYEWSPTGMATFTIFQGANPVPPACEGPQDQTCRKHLNGSGSFSLKPGATDTPLSGTLVDGTLTAGPGHLTIQLSLIDSAPVTVTLLGARINVLTTAATLSGKLGGAVTMADVNDKIIPAMRDSMQASVVRDCTMLQSPPGCGCAADSTGKTHVGMFDTNPQDCSISVEEVRDNSLIVSLFTPDVIVEGVSALSVGVGLHAVVGAFAQP
jgi:hypothetical protein